MKRILLVLCMAAGVMTLRAQNTVNVPHNADEEVFVWKDADAPHRCFQTEDETVDEHLQMRKTSETRFYVFKADPAKATGQAVVVLPGGGYGAVCIRNEGFGVAEYLKSIGVTAVVVKYRLPNYGHKEVPLEDAQEALRYVRKNAKKLNVDPSRVGICGGSAGGHLAAYTSNFTPDEEKPAFAILFYPVITGTTWETHHNTFKRLLGERRTPAEQEYYSLENRVTEKTPPTLLLLSDDDLVVPPISSVLYYQALKRHGVPAVMHIFPSGGHGWAGTSDFKYKAQAQEIIKDWLEICGK